MTAPLEGPAAFLARTERVCEGAALPHAAEVDRDARFPSEAVDALRKERLLGIAFPRALGGEGASLSDLCAITQRLGQSCASTAMIFAMHQIQVLCLVRHSGAQRGLQAFMRRAAEGQLLLASATSEVGVGGDTRTSRCAVETVGDEVHLIKEASVMSYGAYCDGVLATARRAPDAAPSDQSLLLLERDGFSLAQLGGWDTLGMRGTCSAGFKLSGRAPTDYVLAHPFEQISAETMHPVSHVLWAHVWLGIASGAVSTARRYVRAEARKKPGTTPPCALRAAELVAQLHALRGAVHDARHELERRFDAPEELAAMGFQIRMNDLKVSTAEAVVPIVLKAISVCGIAAYRNDTPYALGQKLRDALGAGVLIANDRIYANNAMMLLVSKEE